MPRSRPESLAADLKPLKLLAESLFARSHTFFYSSFVVEEVLPRTSEKLSSSDLDEMDAASVRTEKRCVCIDRGTGGRYANC